MNVSFSQPANSADCPFLTCWRGSKRQEDISQLQEPDAVPGQQHRGLQDSEMLLGHNVQNLDAFEALSKSRQQERDTLPGQQRRTPLFSNSMDSQHEFRIQKQLQIRSRQPLCPIYKLANQSW